MIRGYRFAEKALACIPRESGDDPALVLTQQEAEKYSPRERG